MKAAASFVAGLAYGVTFLCAISTVAFLWNAERRSTEEAAAFRDLARGFAKAGIVAVLIASYYALKGAP